MRELNNSTIPLVTEQFQRLSARLALFTALEKCYEYDGKLIQAYQPVHHNLLLSISSDLCTILETIHPQLTDIPVRTTSEHPCA